MGTVAKIVLGIVIAFVLLAGGCMAIIGGALSSSSDSGGGSASSGSSDTGGGSADDSTDSQPAPSNPKAGTIEIIVKSTGSRSGSVTYMQPASDKMNMSQDNSASFPWHKRWKYDGDLLPGWNMNAQQHGGGTLTCIVKQDGKVLIKNKSNGAYTMVTCQP